MTIYDILEWKEYLEEAKEKLDNNSYQSFDEIFGGVIHSMKGQLNKYPELVRPNPYLEKNQ
jgi:hypothetical protein